MCAFCAVEYSILMVNVELERARGYGQGRRSAHLNTNEAAGQAYDSGDAEITIAGSLNQK